MSEKNKPCVVALGMFDGVHAGHQALVRLAVETAKREGLRAVAYTFETHPRAVFSVPPVPLMTAEERRRALLSLGVDEVVMAPFTKETADTPPEAFIEALLKRFEVRCFVTGSDYTFGKNGAGTVDTLRAMGRKHAFRVLVAPDVLLDGEKVSSTRIRRALDEGDAELARRMLRHDE